MYSYLLFTCPVCIHIYMSMRKNTSLKIMKFKHDAPHATQPTEPYMHTQKLIHTCAKFTLKPPFQQPSRCARSALMHGC